ncbi:transcription factor grauzone-like [Chironomus tepperi]|uniref:transcription factor grauzone-like n=1 Tax=Chironomus tepperi TaxID=113505 RepID=UPI00391FB0D8
MTANCILCITSFPEDKLINIEEQLVYSTSGSEAIQSHFTFYEKIIDTKDSSSQQSACESCWSKLKNFHEFYTSVSINYGVLEEVTEDEKVLMNWEDLIEESHEDAVDYEFSEVEALEECILEEEVDVKDPDILKNPAIVKAEPLPPQKVIPKVLNITPTNLKSMYKTSHFKVRPTPVKIDPEDDLKIKQIANMFCDICSHPLTSFSHARSHYRNEHNTIGYLICCDKKFKQRNRLVDHMNTHFNVSYPCHICGKTFDAKSYLTRHMAYHDDLKLFECDHCGKKFSKKFLVRNHILSTHRYENITPTYECLVDGCSKVFVNEARLKHHMKYTHSKTDQEMCEICSKTFKTKAAVEEHMRIHYRRPEDRYKCDICGHYIADLKSFKRHVKNHETEGMDNTCHYCGKKSPNLNALKKHISFVHEKVKSYQCKYCDKSFKRPRTLIDHEAAVHTLQELYKCSFCPKTFRNQSNMLAHRKKNHPDQYQKPAYMRDVV